MEHVGMLGRPLAHLGVAGDARTPGRPQLEEADRAVSAMLHVGDPRAERPSSRRLDQAPPLELDLGIRLEIVPRGPADAVDPVASIELARVEIHAVEQVPRALRQHDVRVDMEHPAVQLEVGQAVIDPPGLVEGIALAIEAAGRQAAHAMPGARPAGPAVLGCRDDDQVVHVRQEERQGLLQVIGVVHADGHSLNSVHFYLYGILQLEFRDLDQSHIDHGHAVAVP